MIPKSIWELCVSIGHKSDICIICGPKLLPQSLRRNINQQNSLHGYEQTVTPRECNIQTPATHLKSSTSPPKTNPVVSAIMGILDTHSIYNCDVEVHPSSFPAEYKSESVPDLDTTPIKSIYYDEMDYILKLFHS